MVDTVFIYACNSLLFTLVFEVNKSISNYNLKKNRIHNYIEYNLSEFVQIEIVILMLQFKN